MDTSVFFNTLEGSVFNKENYKANQLGKIIDFYADSKKFPVFQDLEIAIIGIPEGRNAGGNKGCAKAPDFIREKLYQLKSAGYSYRVCDLGNIIPGETVQDTYAALTGVMVELLKAGVLPVVIGGSQDLTYAQYVAYQKLEETVNIVSIDSVFDLGSTEEKLSNKSFVGKIILHEPNYLFNFSNIGYQSYLAGVDQVELMDKLYFDSYRLGVIQNKIDETEPVIRNADLLTIDVSAIRQSDAPGNFYASPNGFYGEELCQVVRYAGMSDKLTSIGFYECNPEFDFRNQTAHLVAQMIWYFFEGFYNRKKDLPIVNNSSFVKYNVNVKETEHEIIFYKSKKSERWWMEVPNINRKARYQRHHLVPCTYKDYETALMDEVPERWWQALHKMT